MWEIWGALLHGGRLVVVPHWVTPLAARTSTTCCASERVTVLNQTPTRVPPADRGARRRPRRELALRYVVFGGEALDRRSCGPGTSATATKRPRLVNMYGITETTVHVTYRRSVPR